MPTLLRSRPFFWSVLIAITLFAFALRSYHIESIPAGLYPDEAMNGIDAIEANESGHYRLFYPNNFGREGLFINLQAFSLLMFGNDIPALKLWSGIFGSLAALGTGLLAWELFRSRSAAVICAFLMATSFWTINFGRIGFRAIMTPFLLAFSFYFFFRGLRTQKLLPFAVSGFLFGLGLHTYIAFRVAPLILILLVPFLMLSYERFLQRFWKHALVFLAAAFIAAAPMFYAFVTDPTILSSRSASISVFSPEVNGGDLWGTLAKTISLSLIKYNFVGDQNWRHNYPPYPVLDPIIGTFFLGGLIFSIGMLIRLLGKRLREGRRDIELPVHALLLGGFAAMLVPEFLTDEGLPHALRSIGTQPFVFLFATIPIVFVYRRIARAKAGSKVAVASFLIFVLAGSAVWNITKYFVLFAERPEQHAAFEARTTNMANYLLALPDETNKYVYANIDSNENVTPLGAQPLAFLVHGNIENFTFLKQNTVVKRPAVIIPMRYDSRILDNIRARIPEAYTLDIDLRPGYGTSFTAIFIPE